MNAWLAGQILIVLLSYTTPRMPPAFTPAAGTLAPDLLIAFSSVGVNSCLPDKCVFEKFPGHNIDVCLSHHQGLLCQCQAYLFNYSFYLYIYLPGSQESNKG